MKRNIIPLFGLLFLFFTCTLPVENAVTVAYYPPQCFETPWESQWFEGTDRNFGDWYNLTENQRMNIIKAYVEEELNVNVIEIAHFPLPADMGVCAACGCPRGEHYELLINENDQALMEFNGFRLMDDSTEF